MSDEAAIDRRERLKQDLADEEYREQYAVSALIGNVSAQVQALRRQRGMAQDELAARAQTKQPRISNLEAPSENGKIPNWEIGTLIRVARALGTRLKISFETYGSLVEELDSVTSDSLRRSAPENDPILNSRPKNVPRPDPAAPERIRWMQELMIPWLCDEKLDIQRLTEWLDGRGLPPVGHEEDPYQWLLRGIAVPDLEAREFLETAFAERLAVVLGEQPDVVPLTSDDQDDFLRNLYWTCAGLRKPSSLAEPLWGAYKRLKDTLPPGAVRDALQGALVHNQFGEKKPFVEIWKPMVQHGRRNRLLRGAERIGFRGIIERYIQFEKKDLSSVLWALGEISRQWGSERQPEFEELVKQIPNWEAAAVTKQIAASAHGPGNSWSDWARRLVPTVKEESAPDGAIRAEVQMRGATASAQSVGFNVRTQVQVSGEETNQIVVALRPPNRSYVWNLLATDLSLAIAEGGARSISLGMGYALAVDAVRNPPIQMALS